MKKMFVFVVAVLVSFQVTAVAAGAAAKKISYGHIFTTEHPVHIAAERANDILKQKSGNRLELRLYPAGSFANYKDSIIAVQMGTLDFAPLSTGVDYYKPSGVLIGPYTFADYDHWKKFKQSQVYKEVLDNVGKNAKVKHLAMYTFGFRHTTTKNLVAKTPEDFKNFKLRVVDHPPYPEAATVLGAVGTPLPIGDVYMALNTGVADGQENPFTQIVTMKFYEVQKNLILTGHMLAVAGTIMAQKTWDSLTAADQKIVEEVFADMANHIDKLVIEGEAKLLQELRAKGMNVIEVDKKPFMDRVQLVLKKYPDWVDLYKKIQAVR